jgi:hypothetical protein
VFNFATWKRHAARSDSWRCSLCGDGEGKMTTLTDQDVDSILERFDLTDPKIQRETMAVLVRQLGDLMVFKQYVHDRLDAMKIPVDPYPAKTAETGCRIGSRLDFIEQRLDG